MEQDIHRLAGRPFNVGSAKQLGEVLFDEMKLPRRQADEDRRLGHRCLGAANAGGSGHRTAGAHPRLAAVAEAEIHLCRRAGRTRSIRRPAACTPASRNGIASDRAAVVERSEPAEHSDPHRGRQPHPPRLHRRAGPSCWCSADYSQIELRLLAHVADIPALRESFARGEDIHARTASEVFGMPMAGMDPMTRRRAKAINFGIIYGISGFGLARQLGIAPGEARGYIDAYFARYPGIRTYMERTKEEARDQRLRHHAVRPPLLGAGHRRQEPGAPRPMPNGRRSMRRCKAAPPTSSSARWCGCRRHCAMQACASRLLLQVHDELLFEAPEAEVAALTERGAAGDGECGGAVGAAGGGDRARPHLGRRALRRVMRRARRSPVG